MSNTISWSDFENVLLVAGTVLRAEVNEQARKPALKVIFCSGYSVEMQGTSFRLREGRKFLQKPYHPHKLVQTIRDCLDGKPD